MNTSSTPLGNRAIRAMTPVIIVMPSRAHGDHITKNIAKEESNRKREFNRGEEREIAPRSCHGKSLSLLLWSIIIFIGVK
jgi:hypothetical protein